MMKTLILLLFLFGAALYTGCNPSNSTPPTSDDCGTSTEKEETYTPSLVALFLPDTYLADSLRVYNLWIPVDSICPHSHIAARFKAVMKDIPGRPFYFRAAVEWQILFSRSSNGSLSFGGNEVEWNADVNDVGLAQAFGNASADVFINIYISFRTFGNAQQDSAFFIGNFISASQKLLYHFYKPASENESSTAGKKESFRLAPGQDRKTFYPGFFNQGEVYRKEINTQTKKPSL